MAIVRIDPTIIQQLVLTGMKAITGVAIVAPGQAAPENAAKWVQLLGIEFAGEPRCCGDGEPHHDGITVRLRVGIKVAAGDPVSGGSAGALPSAVSAVAAALGDYYGAHEATRHYVQLNGMSYQPGFADPEQPAAGVAELVIRGRAERVSGSSVKVLP